MLLMLLRVVLSAHHPQEERDRIAIRLHDLTQEQLQESGYFWVDHDRATALATLQDRASRVLLFLKKSQSCLKNIYRAMFPLDDTPSSLLALLTKFQDMSAVRECVRQQLVAGAKAALSVVRLHRPDVDVAAIASGPPVPPAGSSWNMVPHYQVVDRLAEEIVDFFEEQTNVLLLQG